ncbi:MAG: prolyl oligopeptidase family serine peptidase [Chloroflexales bacterium]|nr:prolyl oligopeptidase family serine peptidase [Chloroflexales bacterium]
MRLKSTLYALFVVALLVAAGGPALAQGGNPAVTDQGNNIYLVDGTKGPIPNLLPADEVAKIARLQSETGSVFLVLFSPISPDDTTVFVSGKGRAGFMSLADGTSVPLKLPSDFGAQLSNIFWLDANTMAFYALSTSTGQPTLFAWDRRTGEGRAVSTLPLANQIPVLASADGRKVLLGSVPPVNPANPGAALAAPMAPPTLPGTADSSAGRLELMPQPPVGTRARALSDFAAAFGTVGPGRSSITAGSTLSVLDTVTGERREIVQIAPGAEVSDASFSQDGSQLAVALVVEYIGTYRRFDGALMSEPVYRDLTGNLPPAQNPWLQGNQLVLLDFASGAVRTVRAANGDGAVFAGVSWSPDNRTLLTRMETPAQLRGRRYPVYYSEFRSGGHLRFWDAASLKEIRRLERSEIDATGRQVRAEFVSPDEVIIEAQNRLDRRPYYYNLRSGEFRDLADRAGGYFNIKASNQSRELVFVYTSYTDPPEIYRMRWDGTGLTRLTWDYEAVRQFSRTKQQPVAFTLRDGTTHSGVLILPADAPFPPKNLPIIVWQEGGPQNALFNEWHSTVEQPYALLPNFGFGLLIVPLYGRPGVGRERFEALYDGTNFGQIDIDAQAEIVDQLRARGWANKVGIVGCSYGGYFTNQSIIRHPNTYDAAHAQCSLVDVFTEWSRGYPTLAPVFQGLPPQAAVEEYRRDSPAYNAGRVRTPLLAFHGTADFLPVTLMENYMLQVINNQVPAKLLKFQDAGHGFWSLPLELRSAYELYGAQEQISWFRTYLMER